MSESVQVSTTQRAYTLRLHGIDKNDHAWRDALWATHEAVNLGAKAFGDWLLTLRGGLDHRLAHAPIQVGKGKPDRDPTPHERRDRRILLALSWLSVESAPKESDSYRNLVVALGTDSQAARNEKALKRLREILEARGVTGAEHESWREDCEPSLSAAIRDDAVWIDRSAAFDAAQKQVGASLTRDDVWDMLEPFFGSRDAYLASLTSDETSDDEASPTEDKAKDLVQKAGQWLSSRFGTGKGADFERMAQVYEAISAWAKQQVGPIACSDALASLADALATFNPQSNNVNGILKLISGPGYKSATRNIITAWGTSAATVAPEALTKLAETAGLDVGKCRGNTGGKGRRPYSDAILTTVEKACGFTYLQANGPARHSEFAVMLDHAARRVSIGHSWIKRAEAERQKFKADAEKLDVVPVEAKTWLDNFCRERSTTSGALDAYRIRKRAVEGWKEVVARWGRADCKTEADRIEAARKTQADPDIDKFGDIQLFKALATDKALCVWQAGGKADAQLLLDYAAGTDALAKQKRFKVPAYRHPDPLSHPVFCDFGNSRWDIRFAVHDARKNLADTQAGVVKREAEVQKMQARFDASKSPEKHAKAQAQLTKAKNNLNEVRDKAEWLSNNRALSLGLWDGNSLSTRAALRWSCKRLMNDLGLRQPQDEPTAKAVTRADRLGRAAAGAPADAGAAILGVFEEEYWNGRLQAPRKQLDAIMARVKKSGWDTKAKAMRSRIRWLVSFSAKLQPTGPWIGYQSGFADDAAARPFVSRQGEFAVKHESNNNRAGPAKLILSRLPNLRLLSVDLGHRYAAACAVWESISSDAMRDACREHGHREPQAGDLFIHLKRQARKQISKGRDKGTTKSVLETTIYRRIGADMLPDGKPHPAPWARLDRQFLIKLPGEEQPARAASLRGDVNEVRMIASIASDLGLATEDDRDKGRSVDKLMSRAVRVLTLALKRHAHRAKIAYAFDPATNSVPGIGGSEKPFQRGDETHVEFLTKTLFDWHSLASESKWNDPMARELWNSHIASLEGAEHIDAPIPATQAEQDVSRQQCRKNEESLRKCLEQPARHLTATDCTPIFAAWRQRWCNDDGAPADHAVDHAATGFYAHLRLITDWIMGRRLPGARGDDWKRNVGGLSLTRIATMKSLYQLHKAFAMRARPDKPRGAPEKGESNARVAQSILDAMETMREQRVKQLASRIAGAALGLGGHWKKIERHDDRGRLLLDDDSKPRTRWVWIEDESPKYAACHAVVIENLTNYRPEETRTRRENRQLMSWSSSKVKKYLAEACQLHGLHLREVPANYTSQQDSRTGSPGIRCSDVPTDEFMTRPWWRQEVNRAAAKTAEKKGDARERYLHELNGRIADESTKPNKTLPPTLRLPQNGGEIFVSANPCKCCERQDRKGPSGSHADLNAAANIGLKALLDPDWPGKWWSVPCDRRTSVPLADKIKGCSAVQAGEPLIVSTPTEQAAPPKRKKESSTAKRLVDDKPVNLWRDPSSQPVSRASEGREWQPTPEYFANVRRRVVERLRRETPFTEENPF